VADPSAALVSSPSGDVGAQHGRDARGRFTFGNREALVVGDRSMQFWHEHDRALRELVAGVIANEGHTTEDAPPALTVVADGLAQATLVRDAAFRRVVEAGGPLTTADRVRRAFAVWTAAADRVERYVRLLPSGVRRAPKRVPTLREYLSARSVDAPLTMEIRPARRGCDDHRRTS